ncbi:hypothetical protein GCM10028790_61380 [Micromonospora taraxaci]
MRLVGDVTAYRDAPPAGLLDQANRLPGVGVLLLVEIRDEDVRALPGEGDGDRPADPRVTAGDQRPLAVELAAAPVRLFPVVRLRVHLRGRAGADCCCAG